MDIRLTAREKSVIAAAILGSIAAGFMNGLLGAGGGIILTFVFSYIFSGRAGVSRSGLVCAMAAILPISVFSLTTYGNIMYFEPGFLLSVIVPSALGGIAGAFVGARIRPVWLVRLFAVLVIYSGVRMLIG